MANETWDEVRYYVLSTLPQMNTKLDGLENKIGTMETKLETNMAILATKQQSMTFLVSTVISLVGIAVSYFTKG